jgi:DNA polymerase-1
MIANERNMLRAFALGEDLHLKTAVETTGKRPQDITAEERKKAKAVNFGFLYGMGAKKFTLYARDNYGVEVTLAEAERVRDRFFESYPRLRSWHDRQRRLAERYCRVQSPIGRVRHLPDMRSEDQNIRAESERQAINSPVQSLASDLMLVSLTRLDQTLDGRVARIVGSVHDALLFEVREEHVEETCQRIKEIMEDMDYVKKTFGADITVPIEVELKVGQHWGEGIVLE